ncbi:hypothetical protein BMS3Bbin06_02237 [bacterium BMS3Bbin06]|nr:hypothetical protein BMS3Abin08_01394 [bacterium BMS3Abin08]GBE35694.1 hypothetical protein BMS3Bbin06_02237 [bacterium BMS3Bbin06]HDO36838.1 hypothetical protein [Nitrospirota bacterium]HDY71713.1 hypothetical protein [Nitrospirota bacterium]
MKEESAGICAICAWRATCRKKFFISRKDIRCPDFVRDLSIKDEGGAEEDNKEKEGEKQGPG